MTGHDKLKDIAARLKKGGEIESVTPRELLGWFGEKRRSLRVVQQIRGYLYDNDLRTDPDFAYAYFDGSIKIEYGKDQHYDRYPNAVDVDLGDLRGAPIAPHESAEVIAFPGLEPVPAQRVRINDPTYRIGKLKSANNPPISVAPNDSLTRAVTVMLENDFSQLPVITTPKEVKGVITWTSIGARLAIGRQGGEVREFMDQANVVNSDISLFEAINSIVSSQYALVRDERTQAISGIVTPSDLSIEFRELSEPFLLLAEIENHIRAMIGRAKFTEDELGQANEAFGGSRQEKGVHGLTFEAYKRLLQGDEAWQKIGIKTDRKLFLDKLEKIRIIRNDVMHFDPDGIVDEDKDTLRRFVLFLRKITFYATPIK